MLSRSFFPNFSQGPFPKIAGKGPAMKPMISMDKKIKSTLKLRAGRRSKVCFNCFNCYKLIVLMEYKTISSFISNVMIQ